MLLDRDIIKTEIPENTPGFLLLFFEMPDCLISSFLD
jgi:hypothetical protein